MIGGNVTVQVQTKTVTKNTIGENVASWATVQDLTGWIDLVSGDSRWENYNAKIQESTHVFICDHTSLDARPDNSRLVIGSDVYDITLIDNPMNLNRQLEIYLKKVG